MEYLRSISVVIPAFNEVQSLGECISEAVSELCRLGIAFEIIIVDDGSVDGSESLLAYLSVAEPRIKVVRHATNRGKGCSLRTGLAAAACEWILFIDADLQVPLRELERFDSATRDIDVLVGYRHDKQYTLQRNLISTAYKLFVKTLFGLQARDVGCPFKLLRTSVVKTIGLSTNGFGFDVELLWRLSLSGARFIELPVESVPRRSGESKVTLRRIVACTVELILLRLRHAKL